MIRMIADEADQRNLSAYLAGGIVRDMILKRKNLDLDIVIGDSTETVASAVAKKTKGKLTVYRQFKTATVLLPKGLRVDFATTRSETYAKPGAMPSVKKGSLADDLFRRDFTINAMGLCINRNQFGVLLDEFDGLRDLRQKKIRVLHKDSFSDDPTRVLRAVRFEQRFRFSIEPTTLGLLKTAVKKNFYKTASAGRYFAEFKKILDEEKPMPALKRLKALKAYGFLGEEEAADIPFLEDISQKIARLKRRKECAENYQWWFIYFLSIVAQNSEKFHKKLLEESSFTKEQKKDILSLSQWKSILAELSDEQLSRSCVYKRLKEFSFDFVMFLRIVASSKDIVDKIDRYLLKDCRITLFINGHDLQKESGIPGKKIGFILDRVLEQKLDGTVKNKRDEWKAARLLLKQEC